MQAFGEEGVAFDVAMGAEAGGDAVEIAVVVAGMAAELEGSVGGHGVENLVEGLGVEVAGGGDADGSVGGERRARRGSGAGVRSEFCRRPRSFT